MIYLLFKHGPVLGGRNSHVSSSIRTPLLFYGLPSQPHNFLLLLGPHQNPITVVYVPIKTPTEPQFSLILCTPSEPIGSFLHYTPITL